ncbi:TonB-dependent receptor plug domain-containing protein [Pseudomarimonas arenosa]|uniref:TonB-dependent receptor n=1 Tax=Pseudomarimonas arenosa TaxID=2774145 RepID=A0AAW3ZKJ1_9GAMM|nr:TonB-dependent receptor [Pseudomarimonas arenosa]MBD8524826.1 TonB-dependent receptor [Pseudomarimonas arenosa]
MLTACLVVALPALAHSEADDLQALLDEETAELTRERANSDYVPGIVGVYPRERLQQLGFQTVADAIALVPGLQANRDFAGLPLYFARGVPFFDSAGGFKVLVDGVTLSQENSGISGAVLNMAIQQVERIEVIRGPGSGLWGDYAFVGVINIITRRDDSLVWLGGGSKDRQHAGALLSRSGEIGRFSLGASLRRSGERGGPDQPFSAAREDLNERSRLLTLSAEFAGVELTGSAVGRDFSQAPDPRRFPTDERSAVLRLGKRWTPAEAVAARAYIERGRHHIRTPAIDYDASVWRLGGDLEWGAGLQRWLLRAQLSRNTLRQATFVPPGPPSLPLFVVDDLDQTLVSVLLQDTLALTDRFDLTLGLRADRHGDIGNQLSPRLAAVWRPAEQHTLKAQYSAGLRAPTFQYLYDTAEQPVPAVDFEQVETVDLGYIYRRAGAVGRITLFHSRFDNLRLPPPPYRPGAKAEAVGIELEWEQRLGHRLRLLSNLSWVDPEDQRTTTVAAADSVGYARWIGNLGLLGSVGDSVEWGLHWNYVGQRDLGQMDAPGYDRVDLSLGWVPRAAPRLALRASLRNAFDEDIDALYFFVNRVQRPGWDGRLFDLELEWRFD